jgi:hypothetical protein
MFRPRRSLRAGITVTQSDHIVTNQPGQSGSVREHMVGDAPVEVLKSGVSTLQCGNLNVN